MGKFQKRLEELTKEKQEPIFWANHWHLSQIKDLVTEAKKELGNLKWLEELKEYILKHSIKLTGEPPIFSARHFAKKIDEHKEKLERWFGE